MRIGYVLFNQQMNLDYHRASVSAKGTDRRLGIIEAMVKHGHKVVIYSPCRMPSLQSNSLADWMDDDEEEIDYSFLKSVEIADNVRTPDVDLMWVENGATNTMFSYPDTHKIFPEIKNHSISYVYRCFDLLDKFHGPVIYCQWDSSLFFATGEHIGRKKEELDKLSPRALGVMSFYKDLEGGKKYKLLTTADPDLLVNKYGGNRRANFQLFSHLDHIPVCYSPNTDRKLKPQEHPTWNLTYVGTYDKYRHKQLNHLLASIKNGCIIGKWDDHSVHNLDMVGKKGTQFDVYRFYNNAYCGIQVPNKFDFDTGNMTSRFIQIIRGGAIALVSGYNSNVTDRYVDERFLVKDPLEVKVKVQKIIDMDYEERVRINNMQNDMLTKWTDLDWDKILSLKFKDELDTRHLTM